MNSISLVVIALFRLSFLCWVNFGCFCFSRNWPISSKLLNLCMWSCLLFSLIILLITVVSVVIPCFIPDLVVCSVQFSSVTQLCPTLCDPTDRSTPGLPVHHQLPEFIQTYIHQVGDAIQPSHPLSSLFPSAPNASQHQSLFQWVNASHEVAKVLEFQL